MKFNKFFKDLNTTINLIDNIPNPNEPTEATLAIQKAYVQSLVQSNKGRDYIYKNLLASIIKVLDYSRPFWTEDILSEKVREAFEFIITAYPTDYVWLATYKVLSWSNLEKSDYVMYHFIVNIVRQALEKKETFKDKLRKKADNFERNTDIKEHMESIKKKLEEFYSTRKLILYLIKTKPGSGIAIGKSCSNNMSLFVPILVDPVQYTELFIKAFKELGFTDKDITTEYIDYKDHESYNITLRW